MKQNAKILRFSYENLEVSSTAANNDIKEEFKFREEITSSYSSKLTDSKNTDIIIK